MYAKQSHSYKPWFASKPWFESQTTAHQIAPNIFPSIDFLFDLHKNARAENTTDGVLSLMIRIGWEKLDKYFCATDQAPVYLATIILNPKFKWCYFETK